MKRVWPRILLACIILYGAGASLFLEFVLRDLINNSTDEVKIGYRYAYSVWPGRVMVKDLTFRLQDSNVQMYFEMPQVAVGVNIFTLLKRKFTTRYVDAGELKFFLRFRREAKDAKQISLKALPEIPGITSILKEEKQKLSREPSNPWKVEIRGITIDDAKEIWFEEFRYVGNTKIQGGFFLYPKTRVEVFPSKLEFRNGKVFLSDKSISEHLEGNVSATIALFDPDKVPGLEIFNFVTGQVDLHAQVDGLEFINYYLRNAKQVRFQGGAGEGRVFVKLKEGEFQWGSSLEIESKDLDIQLWNQSLHGRGLVRWKVEEENSLGVKFMDYRIFADKDPHYFVEGKECQVSLSTPSKKVDLPVESLGWKVDIVEARINDLRYFNSYVPKTSRFSFSGGDAKVDLHLAANTAGSKDTAHLQLTSDIARFRIGEKQFYGKLSGETRFEKSDFTAGKAFSPRTQVVLSGLDQKNKDWNLTMGLLNTAVSVKPTSFDTQVKVNATDAAPFMSIFESKVSDVEKLLMRAFPFTDLVARVRAKANPEGLEFSGLRIDSKNASVKGWFRSAKEETADARFLIKAEPIAVGYENEGGKSTIRLQNAEQWFYRDAKSSREMAE